jgi:hypothetical protein
VVGLALRRLECELEKGERDELIGEIQRDMQRTEPDSQKDSEPLP